MQQEKYGKLRDLEQGEQYIPKSGDIIFFRWDWDGSYGYSHTGIVKDCDGVKVYTIEGNTGGGGWTNSTVSEGEYLLTDHRIKAYIES